MIDESFHDSVNALPLTRVMTILPKLYLGIKVNLV